uniref:FA core complex associated protein 24 n=1 Tax=Tetraodon nigroviridis TaxID=99883 RepID=H3BXE1_TETNG
RFRMEGQAGRVGNALPPYGHVIAAERWRNSTLVRELTGGGVKALFESQLGLADFHLPNHTCVLYLAERDVIAGDGYRRKLVRFRKGSGSFQELVLVETSRLSQQDFPRLQRFLALDLGLSLLPVGGQTEAAQLLCQSVSQVQLDGRENPFRRRSCFQLLDPLVLDVVQQVPGVGRVKALALLQHFCSLQQLCNAAPAQLEPLVGPAAALHIRSFFHRPT